MAGHKRFDTPTPRHPMTGSIPRGSMKGFEHMKAQRNFLADDSGLALTEYLILLGLVSTIALAAIITFGTGLGGWWLTWSGFYQSIPDPDTAIALSTR